MSLCVLCHQHPRRVENPFCVTCHAVILRLPRFLRSKDAREFVLRMIKEEIKHAEFHRRAFPPTNEEVRDA